MCALLMENKLRCLEIKIWLYNIIFIELYKTYYLQWNISYIMFFLLDFQKRKSFLIPLDVFMYLTVDAKRGWCDVWSLTCLYLAVASKKLDRLWSGSFVWKLTWLRWIVPRTGLVHIKKHSVIIILVLTFHSQSRKQTVRNQTGNANVRVTTG